MVQTSESPIVALLEANLLAQPGATWVERAEIKRVLDEQQLALLLGPQSGKGRIALGRTLGQADRHSVPAVGDCPDFRGGFAERKWDCPLHARQRGAAELGILFSSACLRADVLVLLEFKQESQQRYAEIVVAETGTGLRLLSRRVPSSDVTEREIGVLAKSIE